VSKLVVPIKKENRTKRVNFLITPSLYKEAKKKSKKMNISLNECVNQLLELWINEK